MSDFYRHLHGLSGHEPAVSAHATVDNHLVDDGESHDYFHQQSPPASAFSGNVKNVTPARIKHRSNSIIGVHPLSNEPQSLLYWTASTNPEINTNPSKYTKAVSFDANNTKNDNVHFFIGKTEKPSSTNHQQPDSSFFDKSTPSAEYSAANRRPSLNRQQSTSNPNLLPLTEDKKQQQHNTTVPLLDNFKHIFDSHQSYVDKMLATVPSTSRYEIGSISRRFGPDFSTDYCVAPAAQSLRRNSSVPLTTMCMQKTDVGGVGTNDSDADKKSLTKSTLSGGVASAEITSTQSFNATVAGLQQQQQLPRKKFSLLGYLQQSDFFSRPMKVSDFDVNALSPSSS